MNEFSLMLGNTKLAALTLKRIDQPFYYYHFESTEAFSEFSPLFDAELHSLDSDDIEQWELDYKQIASIGFILASVAGSIRVSVLVFHIEGENAWLRIA